MDTRLESAKLGLCFWCTLLVPPLMQLVQSSHASSLYSTRVLLACTTRTSVDAACAMMTRPTMFHVQQPCDSYCSKLPRRRLPESPWCMRCAEPKTLNLLAYEVIWLSMTKEDGAGRYCANPQQARECTR